MTVAIISGTSLAASDLFDAWPWQKTLTPFGEVFYRKGPGILLLNRHGPEGKVPPHSINHRANILALSKLGVSEVISFNSVGSLREDLSPGNMVSCSDYVSFFPSTFYDHELTPTVPVIGNALLDTMGERLSCSVTRDCVYVQARGPRFETKAEVRILQPMGDVVGMTLAHEADLCAEIGLSLTSLAMVDNFAHGISREDLGPDRFAELVKGNRDKVNEVFQSVIDLYGTGQ